jgi:hypothetical protein
MKGEMHEPINVVNKQHKIIKSEGIKFDSEKTPLGLLPWPALIDVAKVLAFGADKYGKYNWLKGMEWSRLYDAALRHLVTWINRKDLDSETNLSHLSHCLCCILFLATYEKLGIGTDDRWKNDKSE